MGRVAWQATIQNESGTAQALAQITVRTEGGALATIYSSEAGASLSNPFNTGTDGFAQFWADEGIYEVTADVSGEDQTWEISLVDADNAGKLDADNSWTGSQDFTEAQLQAIDETITATAVDVFLYDTRADSDGGAWRERCQGTSWYNETLNTSTRGATREFPLVALIVAEATTVTIYDALAAGCPMWMVFNSGTYRYVRSTSITSVSAKNGEFFVGGNTPGPSWFSFAADASVFSIMQTGTNYRHVGPVSARNDNSTSDRITINDPNYYIVNNAVNAVAMTVLPDAPIDEATGLPVPTIAVGTDGGVSVINDDGTVADGADARSVRACAFTDDGRLVYGVVESDQRLKIVTDYSSDGFDQDGVNYSTLLGNPLGFYEVRETVPMSGNTYAMQGDLLVLHEAVPDDEPTGMVAAISTTYNTGWMNGACKGAWLSDTDASDLVSGELVTNGDFSSDSTDWTLGTGWSVSGGVATHSAGMGSDILQAGILDGGKTYILEFEVVAVRAASILYVYDKNETYKVIESLITTGVKRVTFAAPDSGDFAIRIGYQGDADIDNISVKLADADRSVNANGLIVNGTIIRTPVATGAELVAYSGFSASNYLEQPYNSDLDFGTGDFSICGWVNTDDTYATFVSLGTPTNLNGYFRLGTYSSPTAVNLEFIVAGNTLRPNTTLPENVWVRFDAVRRSGVIYLYQNGEFLDSMSSANIISLTGDETLLVGVRHDGAQILETGSLSNLRISATAPTAEQIAKIYNDEKALFEENAACTLGGSSDAVTALAHDEVTGELHAGTSSGRSVFQGLRRVGYETDPVGAAISARDGMIAQE